MKTNRLASRAFLTRNSVRVLALAGMSVSAPSIFAATALWNGTVGGGDGFLDATANTEWTGVTANAWDATNGPDNVAQFDSGVGANSETAGTPVVNGIIRNNTGGGISSSSIKLDGANSFIIINTAGQTTQMFAAFAASNGFTKTGAGQFLLIGSVKLITGGITVNQGLLHLDLNTAATVSGVADSTNVITLSGITLELQSRGDGQASSQTLDNFTLNTGSSIIRTNLNGGSGATLALANWPRAGGTNAGVMIHTSSVAINKVTLTSTFLNS